MPTLDWLNRDAAFRTADAVPTRVLRPHAAGHVFGEPGAGGNLLIVEGNTSLCKTHTLGEGGRVLVHLQERNRLDLAAGHLTSISGR